LCGRMVKKLTFHTAGRTPGAGAGWCKLLSCQRVCRVNDVLSQTCLHQKGRVDVAASIRAVAVALSRMGGTQTGRRVH
jgi:hypothetical protein